MQQKAPRNVSWRFALNSYAERFNVEKCPMRCESTGKGRATTTQVLNASTEQQKIVCRQTGELFRAHRTSLKWQFES